MIIAQHTLETTALPENIWALWADASTYKEWDDGIEWSKLNGEFKVGTTGELKPSGGRPIVFTITEMLEGRSFANLTQLSLARLRFHYTMEPTDMGTKLTHCIEVEGPLAWIWAQALRPAFQASLPAAMRKLARLAEKPGGVGRPAPEAVPK
jgi:hypothetical protein